YFGESVLRESHRGRGIGHAFFDHREAAAAAARTPSGDPFSLTAFCGVIRDPDDPRRPADYRPLDSFWVKRGYMPKPYMSGSYEWEEPDSDGEIAHSMQFWVRPLEA
ncbi:MAG: GNAT family N-acetyltransferase, partial [Pseudomonadota bacterium]